MILLGATGDLSNKKILPAIGELIFKNPQLAISIYPWSRKDIDLQKLNASLNKHYQSGYTIKETLIGEYLEVGIISNFLQTHQDDFNIIYLAIPPEQNLPFVKMISRFNNQNFELIIEKPYSQSLEEFEKLNELIFKNRLEGRVNFLDHYLFKDAFGVNPSIQKLLNTCTNQDITSVDIQIQEFLDIQDRKDFYDNTGCIGDMFFHLFNLYTNTIKRINPNDKTPLNYTDFSLVNLVKAQYTSYQEELGKISLTETAFQAIFKYKNINITLQSSKKMPEKITQISIFFANQTQLVWNIYPLAKVELHSKFTYTNLKLKQENSDHYNLFLALIAGDKSNFVSSKDIVCGLSLIRTLQSTNTIIHNY